MLSMRKIAATAGRCRALVPALALAVAGLAAPAPAAGQGDLASSYRVGPRDEVAVRVFEEPQLNVDVRVNEDGTIRLPLVGNVAVEGLTENELAARLKEILERDFLQRASVSVSVLEYRSRPISVIGAVRDPGSLGVSGRLTLVEALTAAGGVTESAGRSVHVLRRSPNGLSDQISISLEELIVRADPDVNIPIFANDLINVPAAVEVTVLCLGEVATPGAYRFRSTERITLLAAIARAGGLTDRAAKRIVIKRQRPGEEPREIVARYNRIVDGRDPDPELEAGDVVVVKESFF